MSNDPTALAVRVELDSRSGSWQVRVPGEPVIGCPTHAQAEQIAHQGAQRDRRLCELVVLDAYAGVIEQRPLTPNTPMACRLPRAPAGARRRGCATHAWPRVAQLTHHGTQRPNAEPMPLRPQTPTPSTARNARGQGLLARPYGDLAARRAGDGRRCAQCEQSMHAAQHLESSLGSAVHARCVRERSSDSVPL